MDSEDRQLLTSINGGGYISLYPESAAHNLDTEDEETDLIIFEFESPTWDENALIDEMERINGMYKKYFDIFQTPVVLIEYPELRFGRIRLPSSRKDEVEKFITKYGLDPHRMLLLHLLAEVYDFTRRELQRWSDPILLNSMRDFIPEVNKIIAIKSVLVDDTIAEINLQVTIKVTPGEEYTFTNQKLIHDYILRDFSNVELLGIEPNFSKKNIDLKPYHNNYEKYFRNQLIRALHKFLCDESDIKPATDKKTSNEQLYFISDYMELCKIDMRDKDNNYITDEPQRWKIIKSTITRHRASF